MKTLIWVGVILLVILHQDNWFWEDETLVFGFIPIGLMWHIGISICAAVLWYMATVFAWPSQLEYHGEGDER